jgi:hypothetical protein
MNPPSYQCKKGSPRDYASRRNASAAMGVGASWFGEAAK